MAFSRMVSAITAFAEDVQHRQFIVRKNECYIVDCGNMIYPKIAPAVIIGVVDRDRLLLSKYAGREYKKYALLAGFTEFGETAGETVAREVFEEVACILESRNIIKASMGD